MKQKLFSVSKEDCNFEFYRGSGNGGQKKQKTSSACRCTHLASGAVGSSEEFREQSKNKQNAFKKMAETEKFKKWLKIECLKKTGAMKEIESNVERSMREVVVEVQKDGKWVNE